MDSGRFAETWVAGRSPVRDGASLTRPSRLRTGSSHVYMLLSISSASSAVTLPGPAASLSPASGTGAVCALLWRSQPIDAEPVEEAGIGNRPPLVRCAVDSTSLERTATSTDAAGPPLPTRAPAAPLRSDDAAGTLLPLRGMPSAALAGVSSAALGVILSAALGEISSAALGGMPSAAPGSSSPFTPTVSLTSRLSASSTTLGSSNRGCQGRSARPGRPLTTVPALGGRPHALP